MKKLAVVMIFAVALALFALPMPLTSAEVVIMPSIFVSPPDVKLWAPCQVSRDIDIAIKIFNEYEDTGVEIYAVAFKLKWENNPVRLNITAVELKPPFNDPTKWFVIKNEFNNTDPDAGEAYYELAITALDTTPGIKDKVVLVDLIFHVEDEPCPNPDGSDVSWVIDLDLVDVKMSTPCGTAIEDFGIGDGKVTITSSRPALWLDPQVFSAGCICKYFTVSVMATNLTKVKGFGLTVSWNNSKLLEANVQCVHVTDLIPPPYAYQAIDVGDDYVEVHVERPCVKPGISCVEGPLVTICFHSIFEYTDRLPEFDEVELNIEEAVIVECGQEVAPKIISVEDATYEALYEWRPKREDLDLSCHVDIVDLGAIAAKYGKVDDVWNDLADPTTGPIDIYDIVVVAKKFCKTN